MTLTVSYQIVTSSSVPGPEPSSVNAPSVESWYASTATSVRSYRSPDIPPCTVLKLRKSEPKIRPSISTAGGETIQVTSLTEAIEFVDARETLWLKTHGTTTVVDPPDAGSMLLEPVDIGDPRPMLPVVERQSVEDCTDS